MELEFGIIIIVLITFFAASVNGALGHGFSSLTVPVALLFYTNRVLNPALVLVEIVINSYILWTNRSGLSKVCRRVCPILIGMVPGIAVGSYILASANPGWIKLLTFVVLIPLILLQAAGVRRPIRSERAVGVPFGAGVGVLYSVTTISGPPLALLFNNQGFVKQEFRAALGLIRVTEAVLATLAYAYLGLFSSETASILWTIIPSVLVGLPVGAYLIRRVNPETFRRLCMSFDAWVVGFGLSAVMIELGVVAQPVAYTLWALIILIDSSLLYNYFSKNKVRYLQTHYQTGKN
ncbi:MAG TPA: sulfite exporter TauE/SafE family protein [Nitrospiria bacterium]|nr:sulfite exporter TauE/SafE family protein [Nitrospiria bacterium]